MRLRGTLCSFQSPAESRSQPLFNFSSRPVSEPFSPACLVNMSDMDILSTLRVQGCRDAGLDVLKSHRGSPLVLEALRVWFLLPSHPGGASPDSWLQTEAPILD